MQFHIKPYFDIHLSQGNQSMKLHTNNAFKLIILIYSNLHVLIRWAKSTYFIYKGGPKSNGPKFLIHF